MPDEKWVTLDTVSGSAIAEMLRGLLEAQGVPVLLSQEGIGESVFPVSIGPLSEIDLMVPEEKLAQAQQVLSDYEAGKFENLYSTDMTTDDVSGEEPE